MALPSSRDKLLPKTGIEFSSPESIGHALQHARMSVRGRSSISWDDLEDLKLVQGCGIRVSIISVILGISRLRTVAWTCQLFAWSLESKGTLKAAHYTLAYLALN